MVRPSLNIPQAICYALFALGNIPIVVSTKGGYVCRSSVCVAATLEDGVMTYEVTPVEPQIGWVAVGFGEHMINTHSVILWRNKDGSTTLSQRYAAGYSEPQVVDHPPRDAKLVDRKNLLPFPASSTTFTFQIPSNHNASESNSNSNTPDLHKHIFAFSAIPPSSAHPSASLTRHQQKGYMNFDFTKEFVAPKRIGSHPKPPQQQHSPASALAYSRMEKLIILHAFFLSLAFLLVLPLGSLTARYGRVLLPIPGQWFRPHWLINFGVAGPLIVLGVLLGPAIVWAKTSYRIHFANGHEQIGPLLLVLYFTQVALGQYIHRRRSRLAKLGPITTPHPPLNILHIALGVSVITLSYFQIRTGLQWWETLTDRGPITAWAWPLWYIWGPLLLVSYLGGYTLLPRQLRQEREATYTRVPVAPSDSDERAHLVNGDDRDEHDA